MNITLGNIISNTKRSLSIEVLNNNKVIGTHKFDKGYCSHGFTESVTIEAEDMYEVFNITRVLVDKKRKKI